MTSSSMSRTPTRPEPSDAVRRLLASALPVLRGHFARNGPCPRLAWSEAAGMSGLPIDLDDPAGSVAELDDGYRPAVLHDLARGIAIAVEEAPGISSIAPLAGRIVAVTGAASGIGAAIAAVFDQAGAVVSGLDRDRAGLARLAAETGCRTIACDVTDARSVRGAFDEIAATCGGLDILVTNAGSAVQAPIADTPLDDLRQSFELNFFAHQRACQEAIRIFRAQGLGGSILFNISNQAVNPGRHFGPYGIPKAATMALMKQYALDHGEEGIRSNGVNAGRIRTGLLTDEMIRERAAARGLTPQDYMAGNLLGEEVTARDVAEAFLSLALLKKVNAAVLTVDGGSMATSLR